MMVDELIRQMAFLDEVEALKVVCRRNRTVDRSRFESSAEHSWHVALMAVVLSEHASARSLDMLKVLKMLLVHDLVEIHAGDTWLYDPKGAQDQAAREKGSAMRLFGVLPEDQAAELQALWEEFESRTTPEAVYAAAIDALQPLANHLCSGSPEDGDSAPSTREVINRKSHIAAASPTLWRLAQSLIDKSAKKGLYR